MTQDELPNPLPDMMEIAGIPCHVHETTALEAWFMMNGFLGHRRGRTRH